jgi:predicted esterase
LWHPTLLDVIEGLAMNQPRIHESQPVLQTGVSLARARRAMILLHGRGASAQSILALSRELPLADTVYLAPEAAGGTWYPNRFIEPIERNEPYLTSALRVVGNLVRMAEEVGIPAERIVLAGFSQGACLALEYAVRSPRRYGAVLGFSGGLIGAPGTTWDYPGAFDETPVFLGCSDVDFHIPKERVIETAEVMRSKGAAVEMVLYPNEGHTINDDELRRAQAMLEQIPEA